MKFIIFGCCSYFARNFCYYLKQHFRKIKLIGVDILENNNNYIDEFIQHDLSCYSNKLTMFNNEIIINFASLSHVDESYMNPTKFMSNNVGIAKVIAKLKPSKGIHISTDEVIDHSNPYSISKYNQEEILKNTNWLFVRPNNLYSCYEFKSDLMPTAPTLWNNIKKSNSLNMVKSADKITRNFLPVQIACPVLLNIVLCSQYKINEIYKGYEIGILKFVDEYDKKYNVKHEITYVPDRQVTDYKYLKNDSISYEIFKEYL